jgi:hypothetical protein
MKKLIKTKYYQLFDKLFGRHRIKMMPLNELEKTLLNLKSHGYLFDEGWILSFKKKEVVDSKGNPKPWLTFPAIHFLEERIDFSIDLFEYGGGNSTLFWANRCKSVTTVEHDYEWYKVLTQKKKDNMSVYFEELAYDNKYCRFPNTLNKKFDIIIVDGRDRVNCCRNGVKSLNEKGVLVLDDSARPPYKDAVNHLNDLGFKSINFWGMEAVYTHKTCTTIFYRDSNCLGI